MSNANDTTRPGANYDPLADAKARTAQQLVELPGFGDGRPWYATLRRLSLLDLAKGGQIPNPLLGAVTELYRDGTIHSGDLTGAGKAMHFVAQQALVSPTMAQLTDAGVTLTDEQLTAIYLYAQRGPNALRIFRRLPGLSGDGAGGADVADAAQ